MINLAIIAATCIVSALAFRNRDLWYKLVLWPPRLTRDHQYWRLVTSGFVHADLQHLLFNMITLYFFGGLMERFWQFHGGHLGYVAFYLGGLIVSTLPSYLQHQRDERYITLGASGAISGVLFGFILLQPWSLIFILFLPLPAIVFAIGYVGYSLYMDYRGVGHINHSAHLWGALYGVVVMILVEPRVTGVFLERLMNPTW